MKLTKPQIELLREAAINGGTTYAAEGYRPRERLLALGLVEIVRGKYSDSIRLTAAGRAALQEREG